MPFFDEVEIARMHAQDKHDCRDCKRGLTKNYCMTCKLYFYVGHAPTCIRLIPIKDGWPPSDGDHDGHKTF